MEKRNIYDIMTSANKKNFIPTDDEIETLNSFMLCRWMANNIHTVEFANFINCNYDMPLKGQYWLARSVMYNVGYLNRKEKQVNISEEEEAISMYYDVSYDVAKEYAKLLPNERKKELVEMFKEGVKK